MTARLLAVLAPLAILPLAWSSSAAQTGQRSVRRVWFGGSRTFNAVLDFGGRAITRIILDPAGRFPDRELNDNAWPRTTAAPKPAGK